MCPTFATTINFTSELKRKSAFSNKFQCNAHFFALNVPDEEAPLCRMHLDTLRAVAAGALAHDKTLAERWLVSLPAALCVELDAANEERDALARVLRIGQLSRRKLRG
jgi:hypothetical protein